jgi:CRISPR-associated protein (TIGR02710 family)
MASYKPIADSLPGLLEIWQVRPGELVVNLGDATPAMAAAMVLAGLSKTSRVSQWMNPSDLGESEDESVEIDGHVRRWVQGNPWDEAATSARQEACGYFNRGWHQAAASLFRDLELRVSGGQKPLYRAFADLSDGYGLWQRCQHRSAWEKLKGALKALEMASLWGGPPGLKALIPAVKANTGFLEKLVLDPHEVKEHMALDLLANAKRSLEQMQDAELAMVILVRALECWAQIKLFQLYKMRTWDVQPDQLPESLREVCRTCFLDDVDGKFKLPMQAQFKTLAGLGDPLGQSFLAQWPKMKPFLDAGLQGLFGHGFEPVKRERVHQFYEIVLKVTGVEDVSLPRFPMLNV